MLEEALREAYAGIKEAGINFVAGLPDGWQRDLHELIQADNDIQYVPVCNEGAGFSICGGAWLGGRKTALLMENSGLRVATEYIARISLQSGIPVVLLMSYRGDLGDELSVLQRARRSLHHDRSPARPRPVGRPRRLH